MKKLPILIICLFLLSGCGNSELKNAYNECVKVCEGMSDSGSSNYKDACDNNLRSESITNLEYFKNYCNCLKENSEDYCVDAVL